MPVIKLTVDQNLLDRVAKASENMSLPVATWCKIQITEALPKSGEAKKDFKAGDYRKGFGYLHSDGAYYSVKELLDTEKELEQMNPDESPFKALADKGF